MKESSEKNIQSQIESLIKGFCSKYLDSELQGYSLSLFGTILEKSLLNIYRGKSEIWAASIMYVIARLNFLFDKDSDNFMSVDELCDYFNVKKSTIGNKATQIEKMYNISIGDKKYTKPEIAKSFEFSMTSEGFIIPSSMASGKEIVIEFAEGEDFEELKRFDEERKRKEKEKLEKEKARKAERNRKIAEEKKKKINPNQLSLFDDLDK
jgi:hypothetical protein